MTLQIASFKSHDFAPSRLVGFFRKVAAAGAERRRRRENNEAFRRWMSHERALQDLGCNELEAERARMDGFKATPLGQLQFASHIFQNCAGRPAQRTPWSNRLET